MDRELLNEIQNWDHRDLANLCAILEIDQSSSIEKILDRIKWLYHSKGLAVGSAYLRNTLSSIKSTISDTQCVSTNEDEIRGIPSYDELIEGACRHLKVFVKNTSLPTLELYLAHEVIISALKKMSPQKRQIFFEKQIDVATMSTDANIPGAKLAGPMTTFALLSASQASGFGVYLASTTALGFLTQAVGITLPFAVYTGMTSTIAFLIGPAGWLAAGLWGVWQIKEPSWRKIIPALIYVIATNSRIRLSQVNLLSQS